TADLLPHAKPSLAKPVRVGQGLPSGSDQIGFTPPQDILGLPEARNSAGSDDQAGAAGFAHRMSNRGRQRHVASEGPRRPNMSGGHAFVPARSGVGIGRRTDLGLLGVLEFAAFGDAQVVESRLGERDSKKYRVLDAIAAGDHLVAEKSAAEHNARPKSASH